MHQVNLIYALSSLTQEEKDEVLSVNSRSELSESISLKFKDVESWITIEEAQNILKSWDRVQRACSKFDHANDAALDWTKEYEKLLEEEGTTVMKSTQQQVEKLLNQCLEMEKPKAVWEDCIAHFDTSEAATIFKKGLSEIPGCKNISYYPIGLRFDLSHAVTWQQIKE
jgi:hypothetical protein